jgi:hypothetical protein
MIHVRRWQVSVKDALWFDIEWDFFIEREATLHHIQSASIHVAVADDRKGFVMNFKP